MIIDFMSQSMIGQMYRCPAQFEFRYIKGIIIPPGVAARRGTSVHTSAQATHLLKIRTGEDLPVDYLTDLASDTYKKLVKEEGVYICKADMGDRNKIIQNGHDAAIRLTKLYRNRVAPYVKPLLVERRVELDVGLEIPVQGTLDLVTEDKVLADLKTTEKSYSQEQVDSSIQLTLYSMLAEKACGFWPTPAIVALVDTKEPKAQIVKTTRNKADADRLVSRIQIMLQQIKAGLFPPCTPDSWVCSEKWCGYHQICKWFTAKREA